MSKHDKNGRVQVVDKSGSGKKSAAKPEVKVEVAPATSVEAILATLTEEQKADLKKALGVKAKKNGDANKGQFEQAAAELCGKVQEILAGEKFPGAFEVSFGRDTDGTYFCNTSRVRAKYGPRKEKSAPVADAAGK